MKRKFVLYLPVISICLFFATESNAQLNTFSSAYFQNQYLLNPAMSGYNVKKASVGTGYHKQGDVNSGPYSMYLTGDYVFTPQMGAGVNLFAEKAGLINTVKVMATYNYVVQLGKEDQQVRFGISAGGVQLRLNDGEVYGDLDDPSLYNFNDQFMKFETDFGVAYSDGKLTVQGAFPNMVSYFSDDNKSLANRATFFGAASYKWYVNKDENGISIEPKIAYRGISGNDDIIDAGANVGLLKNRINVFGMYHSSKNITAGIGIKISEIAQFTAGYTTQSSDYKSYSSGDYEAGLRFFFK
jgi:type IX secretion system PorP/SprF family membrane protein